MPHLKLGNIDDTEKYITLAYMAYQEHPRPGQFSVEKALQYIRDFLSRDLSEVCPLLLEEDDKPLGFLLGSLVEDPFSDNVHAVENHWYVLPKHRRGSGGTKLLEAFEYWSKQNNADAIYISSGNNPVLAELLKRKYGYSNSFGVFTKEI